MHRAQHDMARSVRFSSRFGLIFHPNLFFPGKFLLRMSWGHFFKKMFGKKILPKNHKKKQVSMFDFMGSMLGSSRNIGRELNMGSGTAAAQIAPEDIFKFVQSAGPVLPSEELWVRACEAFVLWIYQRQIQFPMNVTQATRVTNVTLTMSMSQRIVYQLKRVAGSPGHIRHCNSIVNGVVSPIVGRQKRRGFYSFSLSNSAHLIGKVKLPFLLRPSL